MDENKEVEAGQLDLIEKKKPEEVWPSDIREMCRVWFCKALTSEEVHGKLAGMGQTKYTLHQVQSLRSGLHLGARQMRGVDVKWLYDHLYLDDKPNWDVIGEYVEMWSWGGKTRRPKTTREIVAILRIGFKLDTTPKVIDTIRRKRGCNQRLIQKVANERAREERKKKRKAAKLKKSGKKKKATPVSKPPPMENTFPPPCNLHAEATVAEGSTLVIQDIQEIPVDMNVTIEQRPLLLPPEDPIQQAIIDYGVDSETLGLPVSGNKACMQPAFTQPPAHVELLTKVYYGVAITSPDGGGPIMTKVEFGNLPKLFDICEPGEE